MHFKKIRIINYKCFRDTEYVDLSSRFNVVLGKNDAGKSAFLEAACLALPSVPHRSSLTAPDSDTQNDPDSVVDFEAVFEPSDIRQILKGRNAIRILLPGHTGIEVAHNVVNRLSVESLVVGAQWSAGGPRRSWLPVFEQSNQYQTVNYVNAAFPSSVDLRHEANPVGASLSDVLVSGLVRRVFAFRAERLTLGEAQITGTSELTPNASNLASVLSNLMLENPSRFERYMKYVSRIFPHITRVTAPTKPGSAIALLSLWTREYSNERKDLAVPLASSGTGIGQVLAILYAIVDADVSKLIIVDEPQSFLHPGAVRKLLEIMRENDQHQYLISTHAPLFLSEDPPDRLLMVSRGIEESTVTPIARGDQVGLRDFLADVGARPGDVFGADAVLWVEGKTEETCFPSLIRELGQTSLRGVQILGVISTDELAAKHAERVFDVYDRVSRGNLLMPPAIAFVFDREGRTESQRNDLERKSRGLVKWLPRRMFENYLIEPVALSSVLSEIDSKDHSVERVIAWLAVNASAEKFGAPGHAFASDAWLRTVHGGKLLDTMFSDFTEVRHEYDKVKHGAMLCRCLISNPTPSIRELAQMLSALLTESTTVR